MSISTIARLIQSLEAAVNVLGPDATLRQTLSFLHIAQAGNAGLDGITLEKRTDSSQASTSRTMKLLGPVHGLAEFFLDQNDGRRRLTRLLPKGQRLLAKMTDPLSR